VIYLLEIEQSDPKRGKKLYDCSIIYSYFSKKLQEGFFLINIIPNFCLSIFNFLRKINFDYLFLIRPGVYRFRKDFKRLSVHARLAGYLSRQVFIYWPVEESKRDEFNQLFNGRKSINPIK